MTTDPVCGMKVEEAQAPAQTEFEGRTFYFCSEDCKEQFDAEPRRFAQNIEPPETYA
jgi:YHS domain-containing protein